MATVLNKGNESAPVDNSFENVRRSNAGSPLNTIDPLYTGEIILDETSGTLWMASGTTNTTWIPVTRTLV
jgi:hypothetical protein